MVRSRWMVAGLCLLSTGCPSRSKDAPAPPAPSASAVVTADAREPAPLENLLLHTAAEITLSSRVDNPRDFPEHLVDGKPGTAWNGKTGDTAAWIEIKLDPAVHVATIAITAGFDKGDLFEKNLRIKRVRLERDGALLREVDLDPTKRSAQSIPVDAGGGLYTLTVVATEAGTNPKWREIVVSELAVIGTAPPGVHRSESRLPTVKVAPGSAAPPKRAVELWDVKFEHREGTSADDLCASWKAEVLAGVKESQRLGHGLEGYDVAGVRCTAITPVAIEGALPAGWSVVSGVNLQFFDGVAMKDDRHLVLSRSDGTIIGGPCFSTANDIGDSGNPIAWRAAMRVSKGQPVLVLSFVSFSPYGPERSASGPSKDGPFLAEHEARVCRFDRATVTCDEAPTTFQRTTLDKKARDAFLVAPKAALPTLDGSGGIPAL